MRPKKAVADFQVVRYYGDKPSNRAMIESKKTTESTALTVLMPLLLMALPFLFFPFGHLKFDNAATQFVAVKLTCLLPVVILTTVAYRSCRSSEQKTGQHNKRLKELAIVCSSFAALAGVIMAFTENALDLGRKHVTTFKTHADETIHVDRKYYSSLQGCYVGYSYRQESVVIPGLMWCEELHPEERSVEKQLQDFVSD